MGRVKARPRVRAGPGEGRAVFPHGQVRPQGPVHLPPHPRLDLSPPDRRVHRLGGSLSPAGPDCVLDQEAHPDASTLACHRRHRRRPGTRRRACQRRCRTRPHPSYQRGALKFVEVRADGRAATSGRVVALRSRRTGERQRRGGMRYVKDPSVHRCPGRRSGDVVAPARHGAGAVGAVADSGRWPRLLALGGRETRARASW